MASPFFGTKFSKHELQSKLKATLAVAHASVRERPMSLRVTRPMCAVGVLVRDVVDGSDGAMAKPQPLTVKQRLHLDEKVEGEKSSVGTREAHRVECVGSARKPNFPAARAEVRLTRAFGSGTVRQGRCRRERGVEVTVREQQGRWMIHENGEGEMEMKHAHCKHLEPCVYAMSVRHARKMCQKNVRATRSECTPPVAHTVVATTWVRNPETKKKKHQTSSFHFHHDFSQQDVVHQLLSTDHH